MASNEVTGKTKTELRDMRRAYDHPYIDFEDKFCLAKIPRQPEDYNGPPRYCTSQNVKKNGRCKHHGGKNVPRLENLDKLANLKHGMYAKDEHLRESMSNREEELYDWVLSWPYAYGIDLEEDPSAAHDFQTLAIEIVREARGKDYQLRHGEVTQKAVYLPDGQQIDSENVPEALTEVMQSQVRLIQKIKDSLGITRKQQMKDEKAESASELMDDIVGVMGNLVGEKDGYDPDEFDE